MSRIALIDYEMGNLLSVAKALEAVGAQVDIVHSPDRAEQADGVLLPGVGNFGDGMRQLRKSGFDRFVIRWIQSGKPFLGICLGMQMLLDSSDEAPGVPGLGVFHGSVRRFPTGSLKVPHMGWNSVEIKKNSPLWNNIKSGSHFYFVHSFYVQPDDPALTAMTTNYIVDFTAAIQYGNIAATQFHPEKSQDAGLSILNNFVTLSNQWSHKS